MAEIYLNGILEEEVGKYFHICFFGDRDEEPRNVLDNYVFVPRSVCQIVDRSTVAIQDWYVKKKKLTKFIKHAAGPKIQIDMNLLRRRNPRLFRK